MDIHDTVLTFHVSSRARTSMRESYNFNECCNKFVGNFSIKFFFCSPLPTLSAHILFTLIFAIVRLLISYFSWLYHLEDTTIFITSRTFILFLLH